jgi:hypothetical protein
LGVPENDVKLKHLNGCDQEKYAQEGNPREDDRHLKPAG